MTEMIKKKFDKKTGEMLLICPRCGRYMIKLVKKGIILDVCRHCGGMWADKGELEKLSKLTRR